jgi:Na+/proline symporter
VILTAVDWAVVGLYFLASVAIALAFSRRAGRSAEEYFLSGRTVP